MSDGTLELMRAVAAIVAVWFGLVGWKLLPLLAARTAQPKPEGR